MILGGSPPPYRGMRKVFFGAKSLCALVFCVEESLLFSDKSLCAALAPTCKHWIACALVLACSCFGPANGLQATFDGLQAIIDGLQAINDGLQALNDGLQGIIDGLRKLLKRVGFG